MCRWVAYCGPPIYLDTLIFEPENSLINQSRFASQSASATNGDGFGIGWYNAKPEPGLFRDTLPAWNDENLRNVSRQIRSGLFFGHVRASTGTSTSRSNCHPFRHDCHLFMHNGKIGAFGQLRRELSLMIAPALYPNLQGTTDSETFFYLLLTNGLQADPQGALQRSVAQVLDVMHRAAVTEPFKMTAAISDGHSIYALRYASDGDAPSLYYGCGASPDAGDGTVAEEAGNSILILSEPLDQKREQWVAVPQSHVLIAGDGGVAVVPFSI